MLLFTIKRLNEIGFADLYSEDGHSENNRIVNCAPESVVVGKVKTTTINEVLSNIDVNIPIVLKIDTQGAEYEVFQGGIDAIKNRHSFIISEFTPWALSSRIAPQTFLENLSNIFEIYNLGYKRNKCDLLQDFSQFSSEIDGEFPRWTDVLLLQKSRSEINVNILEEIKNSIKLHEANL